MRGYLGIDNGTQGLSIVFTDETLKVLATGEGSYPMVNGLQEGEYEQRTQDWDKALLKAMREVNDKYPDKEVLGIGISGQMHGEVLVGEDGKPIGNVRLWCDSRNEQEGKELTTLFGTKVAKRSTCSRFLWTIRNRPDVARKTRHLTTPAGWIHYRLTGKWNLGIGDASGMFPVNQETLDYDEEMLTKFDELVNDDSVSSLKSILPTVFKAGQDAGSVNTTGSELFGLNPGIPVAAAEGDQPAALAGSLIAEAGLVSMSYGTSIVSNAVGDRPFQGVSDGVDHFCAADGKPINMIWIRNGTTYLNLMVEMFADAMDDTSQGFAKVMPQVLAAKPDCGGLLALPFMDDEPGVGVSQGGTAMIIGWSRENATAGNVVKAALLGSIFNLKLGTGILDEQGYPRTEIVLSGGLTKTPGCGQIVADVFDIPVLILDSGEEGSAWGAAVLAKYRHTKNSDDKTWAEFCKELQQQLSTSRRFEPKSNAVKEYAQVFERYKKLMSIQPMLNEAVHQ
jgi:sugar (pentulose or hexulose) kinase